MQTVKNRLTTTAIMVCALIAIAFGGVAFAAGGWWTSTDNTLTVMAIENSNLAKDIANGEVEVQYDVYKVADAEADETYETFNYTLAPAFENDQIDVQTFLDKALVNSDGGKEWSNFANAAYEITSQFEVEAVEGSPITLVGTKVDETYNASASIDLHENGIFLVVPHGVGAEPLKAVGSYTYTFKPLVVAMPTKVGEGYEDRGYLNPDTDPNELVMTSDTGAWKDSVAIALKVTESPAYGSLKIDKSVVGFKGKPFVCEFTIKSVEGTEPIYENVAQVYVDKAEGCSTIVDQIPLGTTVTITETYPGAGYKLRQEANTQFVINSDEPVEAGQVATFTNEPGGPEEGYGVENKFQMQFDKDKNPEWVLVTEDGKPVPSDSYQGTY